MRVRYTRRARNDLHEIDTYLRERSPHGARSVLAAIGRAVALIAEAPRRGQMTDAPEVRRLAVVRYRYAVYFRVRDEEVHIVHIRHTARQLPTLDDL